jgi:undecaprenyl pyrophosphate phosphatase UppP
MLASLLASLASSETVVAVRRARRTAVFYLLAGLAAFCGIGFLIAALYIWMSDRYGRLETVLSFGFGFLVVAVVIVVTHRMTAGARARRAAERRKSDLTAVGVAAALAVLPGLLRSRAGVGALLAPALAVVAYAIYRENTRPRPGPDEPSD